RAVAPQATDGGAVDDRTTRAAPRWPRADAESRGNLRRGGVESPGTRVAVALRRIVSPTGRSRIMRSPQVVGIGLLLSSVVGCGVKTDDGVEVKASALVVNQANVFGFED